MTSTPNTTAAASEPDSVGIEEFPQTPISAPPKSDEAGDAGDDWLEEIFQIDYGKNMQQVNQVSTSLYFRTNNDEFKFVSGPSATSNNPFQIPYAFESESPDKYKLAGLKLMLPVTHFYDGSARVGERQVACLLTDVTLDITGEQLLAKFLKHIMKRHEDVLQTKRREQFGSPSQSHFGKHPIHTSTPTRRPSTLYIPGVSPGSTCSPNTPCHHPHHYGCAARHLHFEPAVNVVGPNVQSQTSTSSQQGEQADFRSTTNEESPSTYSTPTQEARGENTQEERDRLKEYWAQIGTAGRMFKRAVQSRVRGIRTVGGRGQELDYGNTTPTRRGSSGYINVVGYEERPASPIPPHSPVAPPPSGTPPPSPILHVEGNVVVIKDENSPPSQDNIDNVD